MIHRNTFSEAHFRRSVPLLCSADSGEGRAVLLCLRYYKAFPVQRPFFDFCASCDTRSIMRGKFGTVPNANDRTRTTEDGRANAERASSASRAHIMPMIDRAARPCRRCAAAHSAAELCRRTALDSSSRLCLAAVRKNRKNFYFPIDKPFEKVYYCVSRLIH